MIDGASIRDRLDFEEDHVHEKNAFRGNGLGAR